MHVPHRISQHYKNACKLIIKSKVVETICALMIAGYRERRSGELQVLRY